MSQETEAQNPIHASIIIATCNRATYLERCLQGLADLDTDHGAFEVIVIDNNSTDDTAPVVSAFATAHPEMRIIYVFEAIQGATRARNAGIDRAQGEILCFLDDDAVPSPMWLGEMLKGIHDSSVGCVGGPAILDFQGQPIPSWLQGDLKGLLSGYGLPYSKPTEITAVAQYPFLCNMAVRKNVIDTVGPFRLDLGPSGNKLVVGEETELVDRLRKAGWKTVYLPMAKVDHIVAPERLEKGYIYRSSMRLAVTHIYLTWETKANRILRWFASDAWYSIRMFGRLSLALVRRDPFWFDDYMRFWVAAKRIPLRIEALSRGKTSIAIPKEE